jgi:hypothetical protein
MADRVLYWKNKENLLVVVLLNCFFMVAKLRPAFALLLLGAIHVLLQHNFGLFLTHPPTHLPSQSAPTILFNEVNRIFFWVWNSLVSSLFE